MLAAAGAAEAGARAGPAKAAALPASETVARFAEWVSASRDNEGLPFVVVDKLQAAVFVYRPDGVLSAATPALIGFAPGDDSAPGIGERPLAKITPGERTTPAGRFLAGFRPNGGKREVLWVDYDTAVSLHPLRDVTLSDPQEHRPQRLKTSTPADNRITYGCINVPDAFFDRVVRPAFKDSRGIVYVLPEARPLHDVFPALGRDLGVRQAEDRPKKGWKKWLGFGRRAAPDGPSRSAAVRTSAPG